MIGKTILHYKITEKLGEGGMGVVFRARDSKLDRDVALKFQPAELAAGSRQRDRFRTEARAAAALNHPNIAQIYAIEEHNGELFIVMEYIQGQELRHIVGSPHAAPLPVDQILDIAIQIAEGLQAAHDKGIVHRDIKPGNIMLTEDGRVKIMDFGIASLGQDTHITRAQVPLGTIAYMSPEQARGDPLDLRTDIWSYGVVLYEMLTGELPFQGYYDQAVVYAILNEEPGAFECSDELQPVRQVVLKSLHKDPGQRFGRMSEVLETLKASSRSPVGPDASAPLPAVKKLAVLPFSNLSNDEATDFLGFALADQIIGALAYSRQVLVRPSSSVRKYEGKSVDMQGAGAELMVDYLLTGSYLKQGDSIRLTIELMDLAGQHILWREPVQVPYRNAFELQDLVAQKVVEGLHLRFSREERERMRPDTPQSPLAYEFYLRAIAYPQTMEGSRLAIEMLKRSVQVDPLYAPAYLELGMRHHQFSQVGKDTTRAFDQAERALLKALSLKNDLLQALAYLALIYTDIGKHEEAHSLLQRALKINPNDAWIHFSMSYHYRYIGFLEAAEKEIEIALAIDPGNPRFRSAIITYMFLGRSEKIRSFDLDMDSPFTLNCLGEAYLRLGEREKARTCLQKVVDLKGEIGEFYFAASLLAYMKGDLEAAGEFTRKREGENPSDGEIWYEIARVYGLSGLAGDCRRALARSVDMGYWSYPAMEKDRFLDGVREDPGIQQVLDRARHLHETLRTKLA
ncbi:MAG: tetratricopeptide repeat protein [Calditrichaeota bacterium]|nr:MAG: tetratricopeptide repeat protein [Calditrichota bacterium]